MSTVIKEITLPLKDVKHLFINPDLDPYDNKDYTSVPGLTYALRQLRMKPLPEKIVLKLKLENATGFNVQELKEALHRYCLNTVKEQEEESRYLSWQIKKNFQRAVLPFTLTSIVVGLVMYHIMDERSKWMQILFILLNNFLIVMGWVLLWIPAEMFLYQAPRVKREIALYRLLADAEVTVE